ncbi:hypothetical protein BC629DRAFT_1292498 [Irpex lacteus]|nr:hypothetical protein BC629DRAFT_1292498 [Irpex lacteus]
MKFATFVSLAAAIITASLSAPVRRDVPDNLIPQFGHATGLNPTGTGDCDGIPNAQGVPIKVPCSCPGDFNVFKQKLNANVNAGHVLNNPSVAISFPTDNSKASQHARINAATVTLQNLNGPGVGCPVVSTTFQAQDKAIDAQPDAPPAPAPAPAAPAPAPPANNAASGAAAGAPSAAQIAALAPDLGAAAGKNPDGVGNCDGAVIGGNGAPVKVPCNCPPDRNTFLAALTKDVQAGHAVNNPTVAVSFPLGNSKPEQAARIQASLVALQNLNGPGVGCPAAATTLSAQLAAALS